MKSVVQEWVQQLPMMQQTVLLSALRGPDIGYRDGAAKMLLRWLRRCILISSLDRAILSNPFDERGGIFTGPSIPVPPIDKKWEDVMDQLVREFLKNHEDLPQHYFLHFMHAVEILGYKHCDRRIRGWWYATYIQIGRRLHLHPELEAELDERLSDDRVLWLKHTDHARSN